MKDKEKEKSSQEKTLNRQNLKIKQNQTQEIDLFEKNFETGKNFDYYFPQNNLKNILEKVDILYTYNRKLKKKNHNKGGHQSILSSSRNSLLKNNINPESILKPKL